ncbi:RDD family protein [Frigoriflavimonas asaccharolytica]|uniref:RDD domain-containing protein n=1 Tax=Frigoriflavimonas asaccharolytica TaxID=2735899 RepID=A0A8J8G593_9FLAO|nr:RDD family protein [Frigoriflavimonas asaccharolytica]NRS91509.1 hypothetical protein [Frigoriflavimonas asaccharolytica]
MKISEIKEKRLIHRPTQNFDAGGNRIYQAIDYDFKFDTKSKDNHTARLLSKVIDLIPNIFILIFIFKLNPFLSFLYSIPMVIIIGAISETLTGQTLGKKIFKLKVVDDYGNRPNFSRSFKRNLLCLINLLPTSFYYTKNGRTGPGLAYNFEMHLNNKFSNTFVLNNKVYLEIKNLLHRKE